ncbi:MAG: hypothetical protein IKO72_03335 [Kiritimatiellae bacterium]|nr:hypothetical protein [Kiritimatiellia bacterium]
MRMACAFCLVGVIVSCAASALAADDGSAATSPGGDDYYVSTQGSDANDGLTPETAILTIGEAVERANRTYGSRITVLPGTYSFPGTQEWTTITNAVVLASQTGNPDDVVIDCCGGYGLGTAHALARIEGVSIANSYGGEANGHALWINGGAATNITVCNLTGMVYAAVCISGGTLGGLLFTNNVNDARTTNGGVVLNASESSLIASTFICNKAGGAPVRIKSANCYVEDCNFLTNLYVSSCANQNGGAIFADPNPGSTYIRCCRFIGNAGNESGACFLNRGGTVSDCFFQGNEAFYHGSCFRGWYGSGTIDRCVFIDNIGSDHGVFYFSESTITVRNCLFAGNRSKGGAPGVITSGRANHFLNCTFYGNRSTTGGTHALYLSHQSATVKNCIFYGNGPSADSRNAYVATAANIRNTCYPEAVAGNTTGNFAVSLLFGDAENGEFRLRHGSPCINSGDWTFLGATMDEVMAQKDLAGTSRLLRSQVDMGCFEYVWPTAVLLH